MRFYSCFIIILFIIFSTSCESLSGNEKKLFLIDSTKFSSIYTNGSSFKIDIIALEDKKVDSVICFLANSKISKSTSLKNITASINTERVGENKIKALVYFDSDYQEIEGKIIVGAPFEPKLLNYTLVATYPHDIEAYTQGLEFHRDTLYESTGQNGKSSLRKTDYKTGMVYKKVDLDPNIFGEGLTILNNKAYQLTWKNLAGFVYDVNTLQTEKTFRYPREIEGWGLTNDGKKLYQSNGSENIYIWNANSFEETGKIQAYTNKNKIEALNELEWVNGKIFANIYQLDAIAIINPKSGVVEGVVNLSDLKNKVTKHQNLDVLNGIAYNPKTGTFFVTGKNWDKLFEIKIIGI